MACYDNEVTASHVYCVGRGVKLHSIIGFEKCASEKEFLNL